MTEIRPGRPAARPVVNARPIGAVPPAQYDRMRAPAWTTNPAAPSWAGALNHQRIESRGFRC